MRQTGSMTTTRRWICEIALRLALIVSVFCFALYAQDFSDAGFCALTAFWAYALFRVLFSFFYEAKQRANAALFRSGGTLIKIFRGRLISGVLAFAGAILLSATLALGLADLRGAELFVTLAALPAALALMRLAVLKLSLKEIKNPRILSLKLSILLLAALAVAVNFAINLAYLRLVDGADTTARSQNSAINFTPPASATASVGNFATNDASASVGNLATDNAAKSATNSAASNAAIIVGNSETSNAAKPAPDTAKKPTALPANFREGSVRAVYASATNYKANTAAALQINAKNSTASSAAVQNLAQNPAAPSMVAGSSAEKSATSPASVVEIFEILKSTAPQAHFKSALLNEIYALKFYKNALFELALSQSPSALKIALLFLICAGDFLFYCAILHLCAFVLFMLRATSAPKIGRFSGTIFALAYVTLCLICAAQTRTVAGEADGARPKSAVETGVQIVLQSGERLILSAREADALRGELNATRFAAEANAASALNSYIDAVYDEGARLSAQKMADFNYSFLSDYLVLWHGVWDDDAGAYLNEKFAGFVSESFPKDFGENIAKIAAANVKNYESSLNFTLKKYGAKIDLNVTQSFSLKSKAYRASGTGLGALGGVLGAKLISKSLAKTAAKTGAKTLTKAGASATSGSAGLVCGPGAVVCVPAFAVATWFGLDFAFAKGDEALNREEFEAAIVRDMMAAKEELKRALAEDFNATIDEISSEILNLDGK
ncbi:hypothetical protein [uncultured Campylobacter sp.]|uniref:hypothetical protein n=1 Tax=uncultured Campylobacter sp. TaxID=218934 RepID=UPI002620F7AC|nr:hypothetical protein [uncultured Campylobacter sp.]